MVYSLVYVSSARNRFTVDDLGDILTVSRRNNAASDVTGILLYRDGNLMQVLDEPERQFADWSMAFRDLAELDEASAPGIDPFLSTPLTAEVFGPHPTLVQQLLLVFKDQYATRGRRRSA